MHESDGPACWVDSVRELVRTAAEEAPESFSRWISLLLRHMKWNIFFCFWAMEDVIVSVCDNWTPPPCSQLHGSLQCCSLLNYYQWVWRDTCSLFPLTVSFVTVSPALPHTYKRMYADARPIFRLTCICRMLCEKVRSILCKRQWRGSVDAFTCLFTLDGNYTSTQAQICIRSCMNARVSARKHRCFSAAFSK